MKYVILHAEGMSDHPRQELAGKYNESPPAGTLQKIADRVFPRERV